MVAGARCCTACRRSPGGLACVGAGPLSRDGVDVLTMSPSWVTNCVLYCARVSTSHWVCALYCANVACSGVLGVELRVRQHTEREVGRRRSGDRTSIERHVHRVVVGIGHGHVQGGSHRLTGGTIGRRQKRQARRAPRPGPRTELPEPTWAHQRSFRSRSAQQCRARWCQRSRSCPNDREDRPWALRSACSSQLGSGDRCEQRSRSAPRRARPGRTRMQHLWSSRWFRVMRAGSRPTAGVAPTALLVASRFPSR